MHHDNNWHGDKIMFVYANLRWFMTRLRWCVKRTPRLQPHGIEPTISVEIAALDNCV
jgi:hypothetical protein